MNETSGTPVPPAKGGRLRRIPVQSVVLVLLSAALVVARSVLTLAPGAVVARRWLAPGDARRSPGADAAGERCPSYSRISRMMVRLSRCTVSMNRTVLLMRSITMLCVRAPSAKYRTPFSRLPSVTPVAMT